MGQRLSCAERREGDLLRAVKNGDLEIVESIVRDDPTVLEEAGGSARCTALHMAAAAGHIEVLSMLLDRFHNLNPDVLNRHKQTPLMLAALHGEISCLQRLIEAGANILMFDSVHGRTCLHYAAIYGHSDCLQAILTTAHSSPVAYSWGFTRFVNIRDGNGATPLHLAARHGRPECVHILLDKGALVCASTGGYGYSGSTPLHLAARGGSLDCVRELLARGADRLQRDSSGRTPYMVALKYKNGACAALLNPSAAGPLVWPSTMKFINELNLEAKALLERALIEANMEREKAILKQTAFVDPLSSPLHSGSETDDNSSEDKDVELCCICFDQACTIEVRQCGHQMCAHCMLAMCCHKKPNPATASTAAAPVCPFCRSSITQLVVAKSNAITHNSTEMEASPSRPRRPRKAVNLSEGSSSFKGLTAIGSFGKIGSRNSGRIAAECSEGNDKP